MNIRNFKIGTRLAIGFALVLLLLSLIAGIGIWRLQAVGDATEPWRNGRWSRSGLPPTG